MSKPRLPDLAPQFVAYHRRFPCCPILNPVFIQQRVDDGSLRCLLDDAIDQHNTEAADLVRLLLRVSRDTRRRIAVHVKAHWV